MPSPLSFSSTEDFRKKLLVRNLPPFNSDGFNPTTNPGQSELTLTNYSVVDSAEVEVIGDQEEVKLYINNQYGPPGGYDDRYVVQDVQKIVTQRDEYFKFVSSFYNPVNILFSTNPQGSNGTVSQDSVMMQIAAKSLKNEMQYRVDEEVRQETLGRFNFLNALQDPFIAADILTGRQELIEPDWTISSPTNVIAKGLDYISRISGVYVPFSWIPGDYFEGKKSFLNESVNRIAGFFGANKKLLPEQRTGSDIFLNNTGGGQTNTMFKHFEYNRFRPDYKRNFLSDPNFFAPEPNYYIGDRVQDPNQIVAPVGELPVNQDGDLVPTAVRGYGEIGNLYENNIKFKFGLNTVEPGESPDIQGGFTWSSTEGNSAAGKTVGTGGDVMGSDPNFNSIGSQWQSSSSTNYPFTPGSILDDTQKLVDAADGLQGQARLSHVGTAINQVSKVFFDGTREITKGSRVKRYVNENGIEVGKEYCRVFTKDTPYFTMNDLQKQEGNIRKFQNSVLTNTYNLNIAPQQIGGVPQNFGQRNGENITKYMLSLENLAWRTSKLQQDLPECEKGPAGGRIMWFPPYDLKVDENVTARWNTNDFLGRPEPIYTYSNTQRVGSLSFKIIVDHPSVLNTLVKKELANVTPDSEVTKIVDSFFSGCKTLDIYELLRKFGQFSFNDVYDIVTKTTNPETFRKYYEEIPRETPEITSKPPETDVVPPTLDTDFTGLKLYFDNDFPEGYSTNATTSASKYETYLNAYKNKKQTYITEATKYSGQTEVETFFDQDITNSMSSLNSLITKAVEAANNGYTINITLVGSASSPNSSDYNINLSKRRIDSVKKQILENKQVADVNAGSKGKINIVGEDSQGESSQGSAGNDCSQDFTGTYANIKKVYSVQAMGCRRTTISNIEVIEPEQVEQPEPNDEVINEDVIPEGPLFVEKTEKGQGAPIKTQELQLKQDITKRLLRRMLTECDYFEQLTDDTSFLFEGIKEKVKYFNPTFHSITPEGLNSRLTFLQQCLRPGDTIPTIGPDGKPLQNDALNTSFGTPPICILRVGDFWHTKIAINQMSIRYEPLQLDLNPEGIGVQPMLADVNLSFYFIGGHGLKEPVAKLQNALSFNYYANTEMYDERADYTEDRSEIDAEFASQLEFDTPFNVNNIDNQKTTDGGTPIGDITTQNIEIGTGDTISISGDITYKTIMDDLLDKSIGYKETLVGSLETVANYYGEIGLRLFTKERKYTDGTITIDPAPIVNSISLFGKPLQIDDKLNTQFTKALTDVDNGTFPLIPNNTSKYKNKDVKKYKKKVKEIIERHQNGYSNGMAGEIQKITKGQLELTGVMDKINVVQTEIDGVINQNGSPVVYTITATTETFTDNFSNTLDELQYDYSTVGNTLNGFNTVLDIQDILTTNSSYEYDDNLNTTIQTSSISTESDKRFYLLFFDKILNDKQSLIEELNKFVETNQFTDSDKWKVEISGLISAQDSKFRSAKKDIENLFKGYNDTASQDEEYVDDYTRGKVRKFTFTNDPNAIEAKKTQIAQLYSGNNEGEADKWNNKVKLQ
jgi:outer membrane protein OmpA-like peptidoglycan-associated protein/Holliday junction resolvase RusA-like endonuclease